MSDRSSGGGATALLGALLVLVLLLGGAGFYLFAMRQQQVVALQQARLAELQAVARANTARAEPMLVDAAEQRGRTLEAGDSEHAAGDRGQGVGESDRESGDRRQESGDRRQESGEEIRAAVEAVLREQQEAWNRGDVEAFVEHYWKSDDVTFSSGGKTTRGWEETVRGYKERYPTREAMGQLTFGKLEITPLGRAAALVLGEWRLERGTGDTPVAHDGLEPLAGNFSLVFRKLDGRWVIVHDHTSRGE